VSFAAPIQTRLVLVLGLVAALGLAVFMFSRAGLLGGADETVTPAATPAPHVTQTPRSTTSKPARTPAVKAPARKPAIVLNPGLPANLARALRKERVVVASIWAPAAGDSAARSEAAAGAKQAHAGFVTLNVLEERKARAIEKLAGPISDPSVLIFKRPGVVALRFDGFADAATVAQAAHNTGAR